MAERVVVLPSTLHRGQEIVVGLARVSLSYDDVLVVEDPYGRDELVVRGKRVVVGIDYPVNRPRRLTECLIVEFEKPIVAERESTWVYAPIELSVLVGRSVVARLSPVKVKYCLHGELVGGKICRFYRSPVFFDEPEPLPGTALMRIRYGFGEPLRIPYVVVHAESLDVYISRGGGVYYSTVEATGGKTIVLYKATSSPPRPGLKRVKRSNHLKPRAMTLRLDGGQSG